MAASGVELVNTLGLVAAKAAYEQGEPWLREVKAYIAANRDLFRNHLAAICLTPAWWNRRTYLLWVDFRAYGLSHDELTCRIVDKARLWLDDGSIFGPAGDGFQRFNIACPRATLTDALSVWPVPSMNWKTPSARPDSLPGRSKKSRMAKTRHTGFCISAE